MIGWLRRLFGRTPVLSEAGIRDAATMARLHGASFQRGWSAQEFEQLLLDRAVTAHRAVDRATLCGFILSRAAADESEILSIAVAPSFRGHGLGAQLLNLHLRRLAALGCKAIFLEVDERNEPARKLYRRAGFRDVGRRDAYYRHDNTKSGALIMRRDLT
jgi:ribosomal-protein-alanine N-acetyltransferase